MSGRGVPCPECAGKAVFLPDLEALGRHIEREHRPRMYVAEVDHGVPVFWPKIRCANCDVWVRGVCWPAGGLTFCERCISTPEVHELVADCGRPGCDLVQHHGVRAVTEAEWVHTVWAQSPTDPGWSAL